MRRLANLVVIGGACVLLAACGDSKVAGNGQLVSQDRSITTFKNLEVSGDFVVVVNADESKSTLKIKADENIQPYLVSQVQDDKLILSVKEGFRVVPTAPIQVVINSKAVNQVVLDGKSTLLAVGLRGDNFDFRINGEGSAVLKGSLKAANINMKGDSKVDASSLVTDDANVNILGVGKAMVNVHDKLVVYIKGVGEVTYLGNPPKIDQEIHGGGKLSKG